MTAIAAESHSGRPWHAIPAILVVVLVAVVAMAAAFFASMLHFTEGHLSPPLDDTLIYFQYARQIAHGKVFVYIDGDPATSGSTSFLYPFILAAGYLAGFRDGDLVLFGLALGCVFLVTAALLVRAISKSVMDDAPASTAALLVAVNGWLGWTFFAMMESGLHAVALLGALLLFLRAHCSSRDLAAFCGVLFLLPFCRPELSAIGPGIAAYWVIGRAFEPEARRRPLKLAAPLVAAITGALAYFGAMIWLTGAPRADTYLVQSLLANPYTSSSYKAEHIFHNLLDHLDFSFGFIAPSYLRFGATAFALAGAFAFVADDIRGRAPTIRTLIPVLAVVGLASASLEHDAGAHYHRWAAPYAPLVVILVVRGVVETLRCIPSAPPFAWPAAASMVALAAIPAALSAHEYGRNTKDIYFQQTQAAFWLRDNTPPDTIVAINDAGAIPYYSRRSVYDVVGLVTQDTAEAFAAGTASSWEQIENLPEDRRPDLYAIYPLGLFVQKDFMFLDPIIAFELDEVTIAGAPIKVIFHPDNSLLGSGNSPRELPPRAAAWRIIDRLDVADVTSERRHRYETEQYLPNAGALQALLNTTYAGDSSRVADGGSVNVRETFALRGEPGRPYVLLMRISQERETPVLIEINGADRELTLPATNGLWRDVVIAEGDVLPDELRIIAQVSAQQRFTSFSYWLLQPE